MAHPEPRAIISIMKLRRIWATLLLLVVVCAGDITSAAEPLPVENSSPCRASRPRIIIPTDGQRVLTDAGTLKWQATLSSRVGADGVLPKTKDLAYLTLGMGIRQRWKAQELR
jgi:hypothetical protein